VPRMVGSEMLFPQAIQREAVDQATLELRVGDHLRRRTEAVTGRRPDEFEVIVDAGTAYTELVRHAEELHASLIVVGSHGYAGLTRVFLGDVAERVVQKAGCPVLVARPHAPTRRVLVGTDFSKPAERALHIAAEEARLRQARLTILTSIERYMRDVGWMAEFGAVGNYVEEEYQAERTKAEKQLRHVLERQGVDGDIEVTDVAAAAALIQHASRLDADLLVVGAVGAGWLQRLLIGHVAEKIVRHAPCSVLVVREPAAH
jgi:nucleotide-binding universal stress UspA family protein